MGKNYHHVAPTCERHHDDDQPSSTAIASGFETPVTRVDLSVATTLAPAVSAVEYASPCRVVPNPAVTSSVSFTFTTYDHAWKARMP